MLVFRLVDFYGNPYNLIHAHRGRNTDIFNLTEQEVVLLVAAYAKAERTNMLPAEIKKVV